LGGRENRNLTSDAIAKDKNQGGCRKEEIFRTKQGKENKKRQNEK